MRISSLLKILIFVGMCSNLFGCATAGVFYNFFPHKNEVYLIDWANEEEDGTVHVFATTRDGGYYLLIFPKDIKGIWIPAAEEEDIYREKNPSNLKIISGHSSIAFTELKKSEDRGVAITP